MGNRSAMRFVDIKYPKFREIFTGKRWSAYNSTSKF